MDVCFVAEDWNTGPGETFFPVDKEFNDVEEMGDKKKYKETEQVFQNFIDTKKQKYTKLLQTKSCTDHVGNFVNNMLQFVIVSVGVANIQLQSGHFLLIDSFLNPDIWNEFLALKSIQNRANSVKITFPPSWNGERFYEVSKNEYGTPKNSTTKLRVLCANT